MKQFIYIANSESQNIEVWKFNKHGQINLIQNIETDGNVQPLQIISSKNLLYAGVRPNNKIITYSIDSVGFLKKKAEINIPGHPNYISFDHTETFLFCSSYHSDCISISPLNIYGIPKNPIQVIYNIEGCHAARINKKYNILFATSLKKNCIYFYYLTDFGILTSTEQKLVETGEKSGPRHVVFCPSQDFAYTINELNGTIDLWKICNINNAIQVKKIQNIHIKNSISLNSYWSSDIHLTSCGRFLYASDRMYNIISLFYIDRNENNKISFIRSYQTEEQPRSFCIDINNSFLIVAGEKSNTLAVYKISSETGELTQLDIYKTSKRPLWVTMHNID